MSDLINQNITDKTKIEKTIEVTTIGEEESLKSSTDINKSSNYNILKGLLNNATEISIKTNQTIINYEKYEKDMLFDYIIKIKNSVNSQNNFPDEYNELAVINTSSLIEKYVFGGPSNKANIEFYLKNKLNHVVKAGLTMNKKRDNPCYYKNYESIKANYQGKLFGEIKVQNGFLYDDYIINTNLYSDNIKYRIRVNKFNYSYLLRGTILCNLSPLEFPIYDKNGLIVGKIKKENPYNFLKKDKKNGWSGIDYFTVNFPIASSQDDKILITGLSIMLDILHINDKGNF